MENKEKSPFNQQKYSSQLQELTRISQVLRVYFQDFRKSIEPLIASFNTIQSSLEAVNLGALLEEAFKKFPSELQSAVLSLAENGWYLDLEMSLPALYTLKDEVANGNLAGVEVALVDYFNGRLSEIEGYITAKFPHRAHIIHPAFDAHRRDEFILSIPVLLTQIDGICKETINQYLFITNNKKPSTAIYVNQIAPDNTIEAALLSPLAQTTPISASERERTETFTALNRHIILHGDDLDYGSRVNSLKAISLLNYVAGILPAE